jgi:hypothetical protein
MRLLMVNLIGIKLAKALPTISANKFAKKQEQYIVS